MTVSKGLWLSALFSLLALGETGAAAASTRVETGYLGFPGDTRSDNRGAFNQPFVALSYFNRDERNTFYQLLKVENPAKVVADKRVAFKSLTIWHYRLNEERTALWLQNFLGTHKHLTEDNFYLGLKQHFDYGSLRFNLGLAGHYTVSQSNLTDRDYSGLSGVVLNGNSYYDLPVLPKGWKLNLDYTAAFGRDHEHAAVFGYDTDYGHQLFAALSGPLIRDLNLKLQLTHYQSWGTAPNDGLEYSVAVNYAF
ncbi:outer membrane protein OmpK [Shewanella algae]